jgi:hypothetical protein
MFRARTLRAAGRAVVAVALLSSIAMPASAVGPGVVVATTASPLNVTVDLPIAYVVKVTNNTNNTLKFVQVAGETSPGIQYLGALPGAPACSQVAATCDFSGLAKGATAQAIFYFKAPSVPTTLTFTAHANFDGQTSESPANYQHAVSAPVETIVLPTNQDLVMGHSFGAFRTFTTGLGLLDTNNPHGTTVELPSANAEVTVADLPANHPDAQCPTTLTTCFGQGSSLSVGDGGPIPGGIKVTMRWDSTELPNGMTYQKLRVAHLLTETTFEQVTGMCTFVAGVPTNMPCFEVAPHKLADKDLQATFWLASNRVSRGY